MIYRGPPEKSNQGYADSGPDFLFQVGIWILSLEPLAWFRSVKKQYLFMAQLGSSQNLLSAQNCYLLTTTWGIKFKSIWTMSRIRKNTAMRDTRLPCFTDFKLLLNSTATWCTYGHLFRFLHYTITIIFCRLWFVCCRLCFACAHAAIDSSTSMLK